MLRIGEVFGFDRAPKSQRLSVRAERDSQTHRGPEHGMVILKKGSSLAVADILNSKLSATDRDDPYSNQVGSLKQAVVQRKLASRYRLRGKPPTAAGSKPVTAPSTELDASERLIGRRTSTTRERLAAKSQPAFAVARDAD